MKKTIKLRTLVIASLNCGPIFVARISLTSQNPPIRISQLKAGLRIAINSSSSVLSVFRVKYSMRLLTLSGLKTRSILGSTKPLNQSTLQCFNQRWDSPQAKERVCPTLFALMRVLFCLKTVRLAPMNLLPTAGGKLELCSRTL